MHKTKKVLVTGSLGLIGFETTLLFLKKGFDVIGIDNDLRAKIFGIKTKYKNKLKFLKENYPKKYTHLNFDIRNNIRLSELFKTNGKDFYSVIHTAAQTSHDWARKDPFLDFTVNANGTLNLLEAFRKYSPEAVFIFTSTNKVYGDAVNNLKLEEQKTRYDLPKMDPKYSGIDEKFSIDQSKHSLFGVSKTSADLLVQEYGRYFNLKTGVFRLGVVTGSGQSGNLYQGFLSFFIENVLNNRPINILGYKGKQVRDIISSIDVANAFYYYSQTPLKGEVFNLGGGRKNSISLNELVEKINSIQSRKTKTIYLKDERLGDHKWWISNNSKFKVNFPSWKVTRTPDDIIQEIYNDFNESRQI